MARLLGIIEIESRRYDWEEKKRGEMTRYPDE